LFDEIEVVVSSFAGRHSIRSALLLARAATQKIVTLRCSTVEVKRNGDGCVSAPLLIVSISGSKVQKFCRVHHRAEFNLTTALRKSIQPLAVRARLIA
jgi:hypothetical protein